MVTYHIKCFGMFGKFNTLKLHLFNFLFHRTPKAKKPKRADPRSLQKENSDQVWNELSFFKAENRTLQVDKYALLVLGENKYPS